jgi:hypothetical protein
MLNFQNTGDTGTPVLFLAQCTYDCRRSISNCTVVSIPYQCGNNVWQLQAATAGCRLPGSPAATGGPRLHRSVLVPLHVNSKFASRNFAKPNRTVLVIYCARRHNKTRQHPTRRNIRKYEILTVYCVR